MFLQVVRLSQIDIVTKSMKTQELAKGTCFVFDPVLVIYPAPPIYLPLFPAVTRSVYHLCFLCMPRLAARAEMASSRCGTRKHLVVVVVLTE